MWDQIIIQHLILSWDRIVIRLWIVVWDWSFDTGNKGHI